MHATLIYQSVFFHNKILRTMNNSVEKNGSSYVSKNVTTQRLIKTLDGIFNALSSYSDSITYDLAGLLCSGNNES